VNNPVRVAVLGCGNIAKPYVEDLLRYPAVQLVGAFDLEASKADALNALFGGKTYASLEELLSDSQVEIVLNLSIHHAHYETTLQCLNAGKHVHSEKPLALNAADAFELVRVANERGLRLGSSPFSWMSPANQALWEVLRSGRLGTIRMVYAEVNWGMIESWHPNPAPFYQVGAMWDVGVYPITLSTTMFGPVSNITSVGTTLMPNRTTREGVPFEVSKADWAVSVLQFASGPLMRVTTSFYTGASLQRASFEVHGDEGTVALKDWLNADAEVSFCPRGGEFEPVSFEGTGAYFRWGLAVVDLAEAIREGRPHRATGEQAAHLVEILEAAERSMSVGGPVHVQSTFTQPSPMTKAFEVRS